MKLIGKYNHEVLHKLGAVNVSSNNVETEVSPDINVSNIFWGKLKHRLIMPLMLQALRL